MYCWRTNKQNKKQIPYKSNRNTNQYRLQQNKRVYMNCACLILITKKKQQQLPFNTN